MAGTELDQDFLTKFSCMGTSDKEVLINDLHQLLGSQISRDGCAFFLDMTNWNLQAAVGAFYDYYTCQSTSIPQLTLLSDVTIGNGEPVAPNTRFSKTWRVKNSGVETWPEGSYLSHRSGFTFGSTLRIPLPLLKPGEAVEVTVELLSPAMPGLFQSQWKMCTPSGIPCGDSIWVVVSVEEGGVLGLTQQLSGITTTDPPPSAPSSTIASSSSSSSSSFPHTAAATSMDTLDQQQLHPPHPPPAHNRVMADPVQSLQSVIDSSEQYHVNRDPLGGGAHSIPSTCNPDSSTSDMALGQEHVAHHHQQQQQQAGIELYQTALSTMQEEGEGGAALAGLVSANTTDDSGLWDQSNSSFL